MHPAPFLRFPMSIWLTCEDLVPDGVGRRPCADPAGIGCPPVEVVYIVLQLRITDERLRQDVINRVCGGHGLLDAYGLGRRRELAP